MIATMLTLCIKTIAPVNHTLKFSQLKRENRKRLSKKSGKNDQDPVILGLKLFQLQIPK